MLEFTNEDFDLIIEAVAAFEKEQQIPTGPIPKEILNLGSMLTDMGEKELLRHFKEIKVNAADKKEDLAILKGKLIQAKRAFNIATEMKTV